MNRKVKSHKNTLYGNVEMLGHDDQNLELMCGSLQ